MTKDKRELFAWDFHGTLERGVEIGFWHILKQLAKKWQIKEDFKLEEVRRLYGVSVFDYLHHFFPKSSHKQIKAMMVRVAQVQNQNHLKIYVTAAPGAIEILSKIKKAGHKNIVVSNSHPEHIWPLVKLVRMESLIDEIFAVDRHYTDRKIDVVYEKAKSIKNYAQKHKIEKIIVIGDKPDDIQAGLSIGAITYQYKRPDFPPVKTHAHFQITDFMELLKEI